MAFSLHWFADPIYGDGKYPEIMRKVCGDRLPTFSAEESEQVRGSSDFFGLNSYSTHLAAAPGIRSSLAALGPALKQLGMLGFLHNAWNFTRGGFLADFGVVDAPPRHWERTAMGWAIVPGGFRQLLLHIQDRYSPRGGIVVTENGLAVSADADETRTRFFAGHLRALAEARAFGADVRGYTAWSLLDNYEWAHGFSKRFGLVEVEYQTQRRTPRPVYHWFRQVCATREIPAG
jgi:beta-glucosidase